MTDVVEVIKERLTKRKAMGLISYGVLVDDAEERDWIQEAIDEALDMAIYLERYRHRKGLE